MSALDEKLELLAELEDRQRHLVAKIEALEDRERRRRMITAAEILQSITARIEAARPRLEALVRQQHAGDARMTELALEALEEELAKIPELVLENLLEELPKPEAMH